MSQNNIVMAYSNLKFLSFWLEAKINAKIQLSYKNIEQFLPPNGWNTYVEETDN